VFAAKSFQSGMKILIGPQAQRKAALHRAAAVIGLADRTKQFEIGFGIGIGLENRAIDPVGLNRHGCGDAGFIGHQMPAMGEAVLFLPQGMAMEKGFAVAPPEAHLPLINGHGMDGAINIAVKGRVFTGFRQSGHDIGKWRQHNACHIDRAAGKALCQKTLGKGFDQQPARLECHSDRTSAPLNRNDAFGQSGTGLLDLAWLAHHAPFTGASGRTPRSSNWSLISRLGTLP
jgi:hypothetical protein